MRSDSQFEWDVFVSHNSQQKKWVREAVQQWRELGLQVFFDEDSIPVGFDVVGTIERAIEESSCVAAIISPASVQSTWVAMEWACTLYAQTTDNSSRLVPVILEAVDPEKIRLSVRRLNCIDLTNPRTRRSEYHRLLKRFGLEDDSLREPPDWEPESDYEDGTLETSLAGKESVATVVRTETARAEIELVVRGDYASVSEDDQLQILRAISDLLQTSCDIRILRRRRGSVILRLQLNSRDASRLFWSTKSGQLEHVGVVDAIWLESQPDPQASIVQKVTKIRQQAPNELSEKYHATLLGQLISWTEHHRLLRLLGTGGQGTVYLSEHRLGDHFTLPIALKLFSPEPYKDAAAYNEAMGHMAQVSSRIAQIKHDNLVDVHKCLEYNRIYLLEMEWIDGYDLHRLLSGRMLDRVRECVSVRRWEYLNNVIVTEGPVQPRLKPGIAIAIVRECLAALAALHREGIVHGDIKPSNVMLKRTGNAKIIDIGSAFELDDAPARRTCTPAYAAPEVLESGDLSPRSDLASLGYVLIEMLSGSPPFANLTSYRELLEAKFTLVQRLPQILPEEVVVNELLMSFCRGLVAPDPMRRFPSAEAADLVKEGAASFHRQLVKGDLASEYENEIRLWLEELD